MSPRRPRPERRIIQPPVTHHVERPDYCEPEPKQYNFPRIPPDGPLTPRLRPNGLENAIGFHAQLTREYLDEE